MQNQEHWSEMTLSGNWELTGTPTGGIRHTVDQCKLVKQGSGSARHPKLSSHPSGLVSLNGVDFTRGAEMGEVAPIYHAGAHLHALMHPTCITLLLNFTGLAPP